MREIIFRGKDVDNGKWVQGGYAEILPPPQCFAEENTEKIKYCIVIENGLADWNMPRKYGMCEVDSKTIGQYTGIKDKNGTMIFEGDIVKADDDPELIFEVKFGKCGGVQSDTDTICGYQGFYLSEACDFLKKYYKRKDIFYWVNNENFLEVIGNIHEKGVNYDK